MRRYLKLFVLLLSLLAGTAQAQDGLNLPTELYVLTNGGTVQRYGMGAAGVSTISPEGVFVLDFAIAPDNRWLAYRTESSLDLFNLATGETAAIEGAAAGVPPFRGRGDTMAWSPAGDALAYTTMNGARVWFNTNPPTFVDLRQGQLEQVVWSPEGEYLAAEAEPNIWWLFKRDGSNLTLHSAVPSSNGLAWISPAEVALAPDDGGLSKMNLANANQQTLLLDNTWVYSLPMLMKDGTLAVFGRQKSDAAVEAGYGRLLGLAPDAAQVNNLGEAAIELQNLRWAPGGELMVAFKGGVLALVVPATGQGLMLPISDAVAYSWGPALPSPAEELQLPADGFFLTGDENDVQQVWRLPADGSAPVALTQAETDVTAYAMAPDGKTLAYASGGQLWRQAVGGQPALEALTETSPQAIRDITFSPDGQQIAYWTDSTTEHPEGGIWLVADGAAQLVKQNGPDATTYMPPFYRQPQFAPEGNRLLVTAGEGESTKFQVYDIVNPAAPQFSGSFDGALWLTDGRVLAYGNGVGIGDPAATQPIVAINPADGSQTPLAAIPYPARIVVAREIVPGQVRLVLDNILPGPGALNVVDLATSTGALTPVSSGGFMVNPVLSPDGNWLGGHTTDTGPLTFRNFQTGVQVMLSNPFSASAFQWATRR